MSGNLRTIRNFDTRLIRQLPGDEMFARRRAEAGGWELGAIEPWPCPTASSTFGSFRMSRIDRSISSPRLDDRKLPSSALHTPQPQPAPSARVRYAGLHILPLRGGIGVSGRS